MKHWTSFAPVMLIGAAGCLASKNDVLLLQSDLRTSRAQVAAGDTSILRQLETMQARYNQQMSELNGRLDRANDSLHVLATRLSAFQATASGEFDALNKQNVQIQALVGQATKSVQDIRAQQEVTREQSVGAAVSAAATADSAASTAASIPGVPGPATLYQTAIQQLGQGGYLTARNGFEQLLSSYPNDDRAPAAQLHIADSYKGEGNMAAADSVYQLVVSKYPRTADAATALYRHGLFLRNSNKKTEARAAFNRVVRDYPTSDVASLAKDALKNE